MKRAVIVVAGRVQGVGFRWWAMSQARGLQLVGHAANLPDGTVEVVAQGSEEAVGSIIRRLIEFPSTTGRPGAVAAHTLTWHEIDPTLTSFGYR